MQSDQKLASEKQQLNARGFEHVAVFTCGRTNKIGRSEVATPWEEAEMTAVEWRVRTAVSGMYSDHAAVGPTHWAGVLDDRLGCVGLGRNRIVAQPGCQLQQNNIGADVHDHAV